MTTTRRPATLADTLAAGRPCPTATGRDIRTHADRVAFICELWSFWCDAAAGYVRLAEAGCDDSLADAREALAIADTYAPECVNAA
jgi:hypothetical protein